MAARGRKQEVTIAIHGPPDAVGDKVRDVVVQLIDQLEHVVHEEDGVVVPVQHPLVAVHAQGLVGNEGPQACSQVSRSWPNYLLRLLDVSVHIPGLPVKLR